MLAQWGKQDTVFTCPTAIIYKFYLPGATGQAPMSSPVDYTINLPNTRSVIDTKESDGIGDPIEKIAIKSHSDHSNSGIGKMLILIDAYFVILLQCNKMTK